MSYASKDLGEDKKKREEGNLGGETSKGDGEVGREANIDVNQKKETLLSIFSKQVEHV